MLDWTLENLSADEVARLRSIYEPLTESVRALIDATIRTEVGAETVASAKAEIDAATARLRSEQLQTPLDFVPSVQAKRPVSVTTVSQSSSLTRLWWGSQAKNRWRRGR